MADKSGLFTILLTDMQRNISFKNLTEATKTKTKALTRFNIFKGI